MHDGSDSTRAKLDISWISGGEMQRKRLKMHGNPFKRDKPHRPQLHDIFMSQQTRANTCQDTNRSSYLLCRRLLCLFLRFRLLLRRDLLRESRSDALVFVVAVRALHDRVVVVVIVPLAGNLVLLLLLLGVVLLGGGGGGGRRLVWLAGELVAKVTVAAELAAAGLEWRRLSALKGGLDRPGTA